MPQISMRQGVEHLVLVSTAGKTRSNQYDTDGYNFVSIFDPAGIEIAHGIIPVGMSCQNWSTRPRQDQQRKPTADRQKDATDTRLQNERADETKRLNFNMQSRGSPVIIFDNVDIIKKNY
jgi:hypothetical protein